MKRIYLDQAATTPAHLEVAEAMLRYLTGAFGNPSTAYSFGQEAKRALDEAREKVAALIGAAPKEVFFTSGGTESDNWALRGAAYAPAQNGRHIITSSIEHHAILDVCRLLEEDGFRITYLPVDGHGLVDPDERRAITPETILISVMHANNEVATIEPVAEIAGVTREAGVCFHTDAVQTVGHLPVDVNELGVDLLSIAAHKLYGPKGMGALYIRNGTRMAPLMVGGAQERGMRAGTENVAGIVGFGKAAEIAGRETPAAIPRLRHLRDRLIEGLTQNIPGVRLNGHPERRLPENVNVSVKGVEGEAVVMALDQEGIAVSTGSACGTGAAEPSHVILALGVFPEQARGAVRLTLGRHTTAEDIERVLEVFPRIIGRLRTVAGRRSARECSGCG
ncbi:MAG: cysteine desulfurase NifS [Desulfotomaculales bacterium]